MNMQMMINLPQILKKACKTIQTVSVKNLQSFGPVKIDLWAKEIGKISVLHGKMD